MIAVRFYLTALVVLVVGLTLIAMFPAQALITLSLAVPFVLVGAVGSTIYLGRVYRAQPVPRSRFFRMLVESFFGLMLIGIWIGYLTLARILERAVADGAVVPLILPAPPPSTSAPISALIVVTVFVVPIRFALEVYRRRRISPTNLEADRDDHLDRNE